MPRSSETGNSVPAAPRLGVGHLLIWMAGSSVMLAVFRLLDGGWNFEPAVLRVVAHVYHGLVYGAAVCSFLLIRPAREDHSQQAFPRQPGHWLLVSNGVIALVFCLTGGLEWWSPAYAQQLALHALATFVPSLAYALGAGLARPVTARWTALLAMLAGLHLLQACALGALSLSVNATVPSYEIVLTELLRATQQWGTPLVGALLLIAALLDVTRKAQRDWRHWVGVLVELATIGWIVCTQLTRL